MGRGAKRQVWQMTAHQNTSSQIVQIYCGRVLARNVERSLNSKSQAECPIPGYVLNSRL